MMDISRGYWFVLEFGGEMLSSNIKTVWYGKAGVSNDEFISSLDKFEEGFFYWYVLLCKLEYTVKEITFI